MRVGRIARSPACSEDIARIVKWVGIRPGWIFWLARCCFPLPPALCTFSLSVLLRLLLASTSSVITNLPHWDI